MRSLHAQTSDTKQNRHQSPPLATSDRVSLYDTQFMGTPVRFTTPTTFVGLGTSGCTTVMQIMAHLRSRAKDLPGSVGYLLVDAETDTGVGDPHFVSIGDYGVGTNSAKGRELFLENRELLQNAIQAQVLSLLAGDPRSPTTGTARKATSFHIVAGPGGTSGGSLHPMIGCVHEVAQRLAIQKVYVHVHLLGPDMAVRDIERKPSVLQRDTIYATFGRNLQRILADFAVDEELEEPTLGGRTLLLQSHERVRTVSIFDQTNGEVDFLTTSEMISFVGWTLFQRCFTPIAMHHEARIQDEIGLGTPYEGDG